MKKIILINGSGGCGKSTFIKLCNFLNDEVIELSTVDYVKEVATYLGWDGSKTEENRAFLHDLKMVLEKWNDSPNLNTIKTIMKDKDHLIFFVNVREIESIKKLKSHTFNDSKTYTLLIKNSNVLEITSNEADANVNNFEYDYVIDNSGTVGELLDKAKIFLNSIEEKGLNEKNY